MTDIRQPPYNIVHLTACWPFGEEAWSTSALLIGAGQVPTWVGEVQRGDDEPYEVVVPLAPNGAHLDPMRFVMN